MGCQQKKSGSSEVEVTETRELTSLDAPKKLNATPGERFYGQEPSPFVAEAPDYWMEVPAGQFELVRYQINGARLTVSQAGGGVLMNANRWFGQFGKESLGVEELQALPRIPLGGREAILISVDNATFIGRGGAEQPGQALLGAIAPIGDQIFALKMTGPAEVVSGERENFVEFARTLKNREADSQEEDSPEEADNPSEVDLEAADS